MERKGGGTNNVQGMDDARNVTQNGQQDVDEEIGIAATLEEDTEGWEHDGKDDLDNVAARGRPWLAGCSIYQRISLASFLDRINTYLAVKGMMAVYRVRGAAEVWCKKYRVRLSGGVRDVFYCMVRSGEWSKNAVCYSRGTVRGVFIMLSSDVISGTTRVLRPAPSLASLGAGGACFPHRSATPYACLRNIRLATVDSTEKPWKTGNCSRCQAAGWSKPGQGKG